MQGGTHDGAMVSVTIESRSGRNTRDFAIRRMLNLGSATRSTDTALAHQQEVAKSGIHVALDVPAPRIYPMGTHALTTGGEVQVQGVDTSGEVEIVLLLADQLYVGVGSDHTDRALERTSILWSKQACPNVLAPVLWPFAEVADAWDSFVLKAWVDGKLYQDVGTAAFLRPEDMLRIVRERVPGLPEGGLLIFGGTIVSLDKKLGFGARWDFAIEDPAGGRSIRHGYDVVDILTAVAPPYRVPLYNPQKPASK
jgi:4-hydroxyphenylacetate 3-monooxygenase